jgi:WD40 repeat protein
LPITSVKFKKSDVDGDGVSNVLLAGYSSGYVNVWHFTSQKCLSSVREDRQTLAVAYSPDYKQYASAGSDRSILLYDAPTNKLMSTMEPSRDTSVMDGHMSRVYALKFHPSDTKILLSGGWDDTVQFWDTRQRHSIRKIVGPHICGDALDIEPFTLNVLTGSWRTENQVEIWDFGSGKSLRQLQPLTLKSKVYGCCWMSPNSVLIGGSLGHKVVTIDTEYDTVTGEIGQLDHGVYGVGYCSTISKAGFVAGGKVYMCESAQTKFKTFLTQEP